MPYNCAIPLSIGGDLGGTTTRENCAQVIEDLGWTDVFAADISVGQNFAAGIDNDEVGNPAAGVFL